VADRSVQLNHVSCSGGATPRAPLASPGPSADVPTERGA
jgi:hypothetical protein